jgi:hypothetical protein
MSAENGYQATGRGGKLKFVILIVDFGRRIDKKSLFNFENSAL